ncbi:hypothetical protein ABZ215_33455 [Amycolatopsis sp. NPDC006131]|uniref:hypothetical protein n=1 Tax=Amycolatopsis sp. NPDC006131 TaxID=3156731 RepID=UPI0033BBFA14
MSAHRNVTDVSTATVNTTLGMLFAVAALTVSLIRPDVVGVLAAIPTGWRILLVPVSVAVLLAVVWIGLCTVLPMVLDDKPGRHRPAPGRRRVAA